MDMDIRWLDDGEPRGTVYVLSSLLILMRGFGAGDGGGGGRWIGEMISDEERGAGSGRGCW